jgi:hypothetical protein
MFEPAVLKVVQAAFDTAWERIGDCFLADEREAARDQLADAVMNVAREKSVDVCMMRDAALRVMAARYPEKFIGGNAGQFSKADESPATKKVP